MDMSLKILLNGANGRMGQAIQAVAPELNAKIIAAIDVGESAESAIGTCDAVIDFSVHAATLPMVALAAQQRKPVVIGTTGHTDSERSAITEYAQQLPIVWAGNYSIGVNLLFYLCNKAAEILDTSFHPEIIEMHHRHKVDAPSGTAERLLEIIRTARKLDKSAVRHGREGITGARPDNEIGMHALRGGDVVGDHTVLFAGDGERLELSHKASDRKIFARGALHAARWVVEQPPGLYLMEDVLGFR